MLDNRPSFLANAQDPTQLATPVKLKGSLVDTSFNPENPLEDLVSHIGSA
jgi:hypothetical protein